MANTFIIESDGTVVNSIDSGGGSAVNTSLTTGTPLDDEFELGVTGSTVNVIYGYTPDADDLDASRDDTGNDLLIGGSGEDVIFGGDGTDILGGSGQNDQTINNADVIEIRVFDQTGSNDGQSDPDDTDETYTLLGGDYLFGQSGNDFLDGGDGDDFLDGGEDNDTLFEVVGDGDTNILVGGDGWDWFIIDADQDTSSESASNTDNLEFVYDQTTDFVDLSVAVIKAVGSTALKANPGTALALEVFKESYPIIKDLIDTYILKLETKAEVITTDTSTTIYDFDPTEDVLFVYIGDNDAIGFDGDIQQVNGITGMSFTNNAGDRIVHAGSDRFAGDSEIANSLAQQVFDNALFVGGNGVFRNGEELSLDATEDADLIATISNLSATGGYGSEFLILGAIGPQDNYGTSGTDFVFGTKDFDDALYGYGRSDQSSSDDEGDSIFGLGGEDFLYGGNGSDELHGNEDDDTLFGQGDDDHVIIGALDGSYILTASNFVNEGEVVISEAADGESLEIAFTVESVTATSLDEGDEETLDVEDILSISGGLHGGTGNDTLDGGNGEDWLFGGEGNDDLLGDDGADVLFGGEGRDDLEGGDDNDALFGGEDADNLNGGAGDDSLYGGAGNDLLIGGDGSDLLNGGDGNDDEADYNDDPAAITVNAAANTVTDGYGHTDTLVDIEEVNGSEFDDTYVAGAASLDFDGKGGTDTIDFSGVTGGITINDRDVDENGYGGSFDFLNIETIIGTDFDDTIINEGFGAETVEGGDGNDVISGDVDDSNDNSGDEDSLSGGAGNDTIQGGNQDDTLDGGADTDTVSYSESPAAVSVDLSTGIASDGFGHTDSLSNFENIIGSAFDDTLTGDAADNVIQGGAGSDTITGGEGSDTADYSDVNGPITITIDANSSTITVEDSDGNTDTLTGIENFIGSSSDADTVLFNNGASSVGFLFQDIEILEQTLIVTTLEDELDSSITVDDLSLREALSIVETDGVIEFSETLADGTIFLDGTLGELAINTSLTIDAADFNIAIDAGGNSRVFTIDDGSDATSSTVSLTGLTITGGNATGQGGGIYSSEVLSLDEVVISNNQASAEGGGLFSQGDSLDISNSLIAGNTTTSDGGGIANLGGTVTLSTVQLDGNMASDDGGALFSDGGTVDVTDSILSENIATSEGGGLFSNAASVTLTGTTIRDGSATDGGAISASGGTVSLSASTLSGNTATDDGGAIKTNSSGVLSISNDSSLTNNAANDLGGAIFNNSSTVTIDTSSVTDNSANDDGGGLFHRNGTATITNSTLSNNAALDNGGAIYNDAGTIDISASTLSANSADDDGGALVNVDGNVSLTTSTVSNNSANVFGGGISNHGSDNNDQSILTISNSTIFGNTNSGTATLVKGGGIFNERGTLTLTNSTVASNAVGNVGGGGIANASRGTLNIESSIIANNAGESGTLYPDVDNFTGNSTDIVVSNSLVETLDNDATDNGNNVFGVDPNLDPNGLQDNGGSTQTVALLPGSAAIDAGSNPDGLSTDQRGTGFEREDNGTADIGAYEFSDSLLIVDTLTDEEDGSITDGDISLRDAIANITVGGTILFSSALADGTLTLDANLGEIDITQSLTLDAGDNNITLDANQNSRVLNINGNDDNTDVTLDGLTITGGRLTNSSQRGAGISISAGDEEKTTVTIRNSTITGNTSAADGGGIVVDGHNSYTPLDANAPYNANLYLYNSSILNNYAAESGGGIYARDLNRITITGSTIANNFAEGDGGGIRADLQGAQNTLSITDSTIAFNTSNDSGGGIYVDQSFASRIGTATLKNVTITGNEAVSGAGGIRNQGHVTITSSIVAGNTLTGSSSNSSYQDDLSNSTGTNDSPIMSVGYSLIGEGTITNDQGNNLIDVDPGLDAAGLQDNGGDTLTIALQADSPAIDAGSSDSTTDQRGELRPAGEQDDIGAYELQPLELNDDVVDIDENTSVDTLITTLTPVEAEGVDITYSISNNLDVDGDGNNAVRLDGDQLLVNDSDDFNFENRADLPITVEVTNGTAATDANLWIRLNDVSEAPTALALDNDSVDESSDIGTDVGTFSTTDPDADDTTFTYELVSGTGSDDNGSFSLTSDGVLQTNAVFDFSSQSTYDIRVQTTDPDGFSYQEAFTIDVNELADVYGTAFDVTNDHVLSGAASIDFSIVNNSSQTDAGSFEISFVYSADDDIDIDGGDEILGTYTVNSLAAGNTLSDSITVSLPTDTLYTNALADDITGQDNTYVSSSVEYIGMVIDYDGDISESDTVNNRNLGLSTDFDDITYFPWDIDSSGQITATDTIYAINRLGATTTDSNYDALVDFDGNGVITATDVIGSINRLGYSINPDVLLT